jgi:hypothetical protein
VFARLILTAVFLYSQVEEAGYAPLAIYSHPFEFEEFYDRFKDESRLILDLGDVWKNDSSKLNLTLVQKFKGQTRSDRIGDPRLLLTSYSEGGWRYLEFHEVAFLADDSLRLKFKPEHKGEVLTHLVSETLWVEPSLEQFLKLAHATVLEVRVGLDAFPLTGARLNAIEEFSSYLGEPTVRISTPASKKRITEARSLELKGRDDEARAAYQQIIGLDSRRYEASEAKLAIKRLNDPARVSAYKAHKVAISKAETARMQDAEAKRTRAKIQQNLRLGKNLERTNRRAALSYYGDILKLSNGLEPEPTELKSARDRIKALESGK